MISGKVVTKYDSGEFDLGVEKVVKQWRNSKAADANSLVGKSVLVGPRKDGGESIAKFISILEVGEVITIDVAHTGIALWVDDELHLLHAPLVGEEVQISGVPLAERITRIDGQDGIIVARPVER